MDWQEIVVECSDEGVEAVANIASEIGAGGVAIEDPKEVGEKIRDGVWDAYELPKYLTEGQNVLVRVYLPVNDGFPSRLEDFRQRLDNLNTLLLPGCIKNITFTTVKEEDWAECWKAFYKPIRIGDRFLIKPTWENTTPESGDLVIELDPGMAFGTGTHPTTMLCLEFLPNIIAKGDLVYDVGTGSGILAIACAKLGARVVSIDIDEVAVKTALENVAVNKVSEKVVVKMGNLLIEEREKAQVVVANIVANVIREVIPQAKEKLIIGGLLLSSGIYKDRLPEVYQWLEDNGFQTIETRMSGDWAAVLASREE